jgi:hypothetical protein
VTSKFQHFIITRFNLHRKTTAPTNGARDLTDEWYAHRFFLFRSICCPSIAGQETQNFEWIVLFDTKTPRKWLGLIGKLESTLAVARFRFVDGDLPLAENIRSMIDQRLDPCATHIITTHFDNDDALSDCFVKETQKLFKAQSCRTIVDCTRGYVLQLEPGKELREKKVRFGPFLSLIEPVREYRTVYAVKHMDWKKEPVGVAICSRRGLWLQVVHSRNVLNRMHRTSPIRSRKCLMSFHIDSEILSNMPGRAARLLDALTFVVEDALPLFFKQIRKFAKSRKQLVVIFGAFKLFRRLRTDRRHNVQSKGF